MESRQNYKRKKGEKGNQEREREGEREKKRERERFNKRLKKDLIKDQLGLINHQSTYGYPLICYQTSTSQFPLLVNTKIYLKAHKFKLKYR